MEKFFRKVGRLPSECELIDKLLKRYGNLEVVMTMDMDTFLELLRLILEKEKEERAYQQWCAMLPFMSLSMLEYVPFEEYADRLTGKNIDLRPREDIIREIEELHNKGGANK